MQGHSRSSMLIPLKSMA